MTSRNLHLLPAHEAARRLRDGSVDSVELVEACLARARETGSAERDFAFLDPELAFAQARSADEWRRGGRPVGPLHGVPVAVEDVFDTGDLPAEYGSAFHAGRTPSRDAAVVELLRGAGAVILGKTVTTELGTEVAPGARSAPGGAGGGTAGAAGAAAAIAAGAVPLAVGSQTVGAVLVSAARAGVVGFKPTHGLVPRHGMVARSRTLDQVGVFGRAVEDVALAAAQLQAHDDRDPDTRPRARSPMVEVAAEEPPLPPVLAFVRTPWWDRTSEDTRLAFHELLAHLGSQVEEVELTPAAAEAWEWHRAVFEAEAAASFDRQWERGRDAMGEAVRALLQRGRAVTALDYQRALQGARSSYEGLLELFEQRYDAFLTASVPGRAAGGWPLGDPSFCIPWTLFGMPAITLPLLEGEDRAPMGVQLVGARDLDARLLRTARWLGRRVAGEET